MWGGAEASLQQPEELRPSMPHSCPELAEPAKPRKVPVRRDRRRQTFATGHQA